MFIKEVVNYADLLQIAKENHTYKNKAVLKEGQNTLLEWCDRFVNNQSPQTVCNMALKDFRTKEFIFPENRIPNNVYDFCHMIIRLSLQNDLNVHIDKQLNEENVLKIPMKFNTNIGISNYPCILSMHQEALSRIKKVINEVKQLTGNSLNNIELNQEANMDIQFHLQPENTHIRYSKLKYILSTLGTLTVVLDFEEGLQIRSIINLNKLGV